MEKGYYKPGDRRLPAADLNAFAETARRVSDKQAGGKEPGIHRKLKAGTDYVINTGATDLGRYELAEVTDPMTASGVVGVAPYSEEPEDGKGIYAITLMPIKAGGFDEYGEQTAGVAGRAAFSGGPWKLDVSGTEWEDANVGDWIGPNSNLEVVIDNVSGVAVVQFTSGSLLIPAQANGAARTFTVHHENEDADYASIKDGLWDLRNRYRGKHYNRLGVKQVTLNVLQGHIESETIAMSNVDISWIRVISEDDYIKCGYDGWSIFLSFARSSLPDFDCYFDMQGFETTPMFVSGSRANFLPSFKNISGVSLPMRIYNSQVSFSPDSNGWLQFDAGNTTDASVWIRGSQIHVGDNLSNVDYDMVIYRSNVMVADAGLTLQSGKNLRVEQGSRFYCRYFIEGSGDNYIIVNNGSILRAGETTIATPYTLGYSDGIKDIDSLYCMSSFVSASEIKNINTVRVDGGGIISAYSYVTITNYDRYSGVILGDDAVTATGTFESQDNKTVTVDRGLITDIT